MALSDAYVQSWTRLRRLRRYLVLIWLLFLPYFIIVTNLAKKYAPGLLKVFGKASTFPGVSGLYVFLFIPMVVTWVLISKINSFKCPRCRNSFDPLGSSKYEAQWIWGTLRQLRIEEIQP